MSKKNSIFRYDCVSENYAFLIKFPFTIKSFLFTITPFISRITRFLVRSAVIFDSNIYLIYDKHIWRLDLKSNCPSLRKIFKFKRGNMALNLTVISNKEADKVNLVPGIYFGEYFSNPNMLEVNVFRINEDNVDLVYTFPPNTVNHIHNIIYDRFRACLWVLAGDFEKGASIWKTDNGFKTLICVCNNNQKFRSCVAFPMQDGLLYATDSQFLKNEVRLLTIDSNFKFSKLIGEINGPCIYGTEVSGQMFISTATEPSTGKSFSYLDLFKCKPGEGVKKNRSDVYLINNNLNIKLIFSKEKDLLPYYLAQFGNITFPSGKNNTNKLFTYSIANKVNDMSTEIRNLL